MATRFALEAAREVADAAGRPVMVIASRRQIDCEHAGGGYVGWTTADWCDRSARDGGRARLLIVRDHGGPYQHPRDIRTQASPQAAMASAVESLGCDIQSGVELLHIDTSLGPGGAPEHLPVAMQRAVELVTACAEIAGRAGRAVAFELGVEVQSEHIAEPQVFTSQIAPLIDEVGRACGAVPVFVVAQTGTKVTGRRNAGLLQGATAAAGQERRLRGLATAVQALGSRLKAHNCDYLSEHAVKRLQAAGAWMNVSPELGSAQTIAVLRAARESRLDGVMDTFCDAVVEAGYWRKWADGSEDAISDREKVLLGGSYLFSAPAFAELEDRLDLALRPRRLSTRRIAVDAARAVVRRYIC
jgi:tagatose-1,6-bisphosphate aldolase non-catalytic subunit AgaZ/GatZ